MNNKLSFEFRVQCVNFFQDETSYIQHPALSIPHPTFHITLIIHLQLHQFYPVVCYFYAFECIFLNPNNFI